MPPVVQTALGASLRQILETEDLLPGDAPSYEACKAIWLTHPLGAKMVESPVRLAQFQDREISIPGAPEDPLRDRFQQVWNEMRMTDHLLNVRTQARVYGLAGIGCGEVGRLGEAVDLRSLWKSELFFNVFDPLNIPGLITNQDPNSPDYQKPNDIIVNGKRWHRSRVNVVQNESPVYIAWTSSTYAYSGRSSFQRAFYPLKSFLQTMVTDDLVSKKAGLIIARMESSGTIVDRIMEAVASVKRVMLRLARTGNVMTIGLQESVESINLRNVDASMRESRSNIIKNIATANDMPAKLLTQESFVEGFGEGTEDAKAVAQYIDRVRIEMKPEYAWADVIVQHRAWSPEFYATIQERYPNDYGDVEYETALVEWRNAFSAVWPDLIKEPPSELIQVDKDKMEAAIAVVQVAGPLLEGAPNSQAAVIQFLADQINSLEHMFAGAKLDLDMDEVLDMLEQRAKDAEEQRERLAEGGGAPGGAKTPQQQLAEEEGASRPRHPFASTDSAGGRLVALPRR